MLGFSMTPNSGSNLQLTIPCDGQQLNLSSWPYGFLLTPLRLSNLASHAAAQTTWPRIARSEHLSRLPAFAARCATTSATVPGTVHYFQMSPFPARTPQPHTNHPTTDDDNICRVYNKRAFCFRGAKCHYCAHLLSL